MTNHLTGADLDEIESHLARCQRNGAKYVSITDQRVESLLAMARRLREIERAWGVGTHLVTCKEQLT